MDLNDIVKDRRLTRKQADILLMFEELISYELTAAHDKFMKETIRIVKANVEEPQATALLQLIHEATEKVIK